MEETDIPLKKSDFESALRSLRSDHERSKDNPGSYQSDSCQRCFDCMFTTKSADCYQCTYCDQCSNCSQCTHCSKCDHVYESSYCIESTNCTRSSYLIMSEDCHECVFCFGCIGLVKKEFHILNQPFKKDQYFRLLEKLQKVFPAAKRA